VVAGKLELRQQVDLVEVLNGLHLTQGIYGDGLHCNVAFVCRRTAGYAISLVSLVFLNLHTASFPTGWQ